MAADTLVREPPDSGAGIEDELGQDDRKFARCCSPVSSASGARKQEMGLT
jgi:hypothetical protein